MSRPIRPKNTSGRNGPLEGRESDGCRRHAGEIEMAEAHRAEAVDEAARAHGDDHGDQREKRDAARQQFQRPALHLGDETLMEEDRPS